MKSMEDKIDKIMEDMGALKVDVAVIRVDLNHHIKRTDMLQDIVNNELVPIKGHVDQVKFIFRACAWVASLAGLIKVIAIFKGLL